MKHAETRKVMVQGFEWEYTPYYLNGTPYVCMSEITRLYQECGNQKMQEIMERAEEMDSLICHDVSWHRDFVAIRELDTWRGDAPWGGESRQFYNSPAILNWNSEEHESWYPENGWLAFCGWLTGAYDVTEFTYCGETYPIEAISNEEMVVEDLLERYLEETPSELSLLDTASTEYLNRMKLKEMEQEIAFMRYEISNLKEKEKMCR